MGSIFQKNMLLDGACGHFGPSSRPVVYAHPPSINDTQTTIVKVELGGAGFIGGGCANAAVSRIDEIMAKANSQCVGGCAHVRRGRHCCCASLHHSSEAESRNLSERKIALSVTDSAINPWDKQAAPRRVHLLLRHVHSLRGIQ